MKTKSTKIPFRQKVLSMTAGEIIMSMVKGLEKPATKINMGTFGESRNGVCYGCAATNAICQIAKVKFTPLNIDYDVDKAKTINSTENFLNLFENAIDSLRCGNIYEYNEYAAQGKFRRIQNPNNLELPHLFTNFTQEELDIYKKLAKVQRK